MPHSQPSNQDFAPQLGGDARQASDLKVLTDIAASLSMDVDVEHLLDSFLGTMVRLSNAHAGIVRYRSPCRQDKHDHADDDGVQVVEVARRAGNLAQTGINDMNYSFSIVLLDSIREPYTCTRFRKPDECLELSGCDRYRFILFSNPSEFEVITDEGIFCLSG